MKNSITKLSALIILCIHANQLLSQNRDVIWVHGYKDDSKFWEGYEELFNESHRINSTNDHLSSKSGIGFMTTQINNRITTSNNTILIGHSMGGVASAALQRDTRGVITVGAPLNGAAIVNSIKSDRVTAETSYAANELVAGPSILFSSTYILLDALGIDWTANAVASIMEDFVDDEISRHENQTFEDLSSGSLYMNNPNRYNSDVPKISIWGNEESPVHYRLASYSEYEDDAKLVTEINKIKDIYWLHYIAHRVEDWQYVIDPVGSTINNNISKAWKRGYDYLNNSEKNWKYLIGATKSVSSTYQVLLNRACDDQPELGMGRIKKDACWEWVTITSYSTVMTPSDGLINQNSQQAQNTLNWQADLVEARSVNHMEMGNHPEMERILNNIFDGRRNGAFLIPRKN